MHLYHYCPLQTFAAIFDSGTLRLTDISKSNDSQELKYLIPVLGNALKQSFLAEARRAKYFKNNINELCFFDTVDSWLKETFITNRRTCYVICFSQEPDLLSQWRGYAADGTGASIGIDQQELANTKISGMKLRQIVYDKRKQKGNARLLADKVVHLLKVKAKNDVIKEQDINGALTLFIDEFSLLLATAKAPFFKEEKEWRLFLYAGENALTNERFLFTNGNCKKYIDFKIADIIEAVAPMDIRLGPKCQAKAKDIEAYLASKKIAGKVTPSKGTYV